MILSVVIPNYNGLAHLKRCLPALKKQTLSNFEILLVDNGSSDSSIAYVQMHYPHIRILVSAQNHGFGAAVNAGIRAANAEYVMLLNNDTLPAPDCLALLLDRIRQLPAVFSVGARMLTLDKPHVIDTDGDFYSVMGYAFCRNQGTVSRRLKPGPVFSNCAGAAIYHKTALLKIGLFDERFFAYLEDVDLGFRARLHGYENIILPQALVLHSGSGTTKSKYTRFKVFHSARNNIWLLKKNFTLLQLTVYMPFLTAGTLLKYLYFKKYGFGKSYIQGLLQGIRTCGQFAAFPSSRRTLKNTWQTEWLVLKGTMLYIRRFLNL